ncbi:hypothetical protein [Microcella humidisoli]|uniref:Uncharacterized protein n=1 Tax=Microcella humidisoli TaxID=2963406 RepID=A0ABY5FXI2_9MICO|nr:hypothetical protein [Microcella humidisoli]UTT63016.1 hypothetical protein NNL39_02595 [Microcella humidisoli]
MTRTTPPSADEPRLGPLGWLSAFARALVALPSFRRHMTLVEASLNRQVRALEVRMDELERLALTGGSARPGTLTADAHDESTGELGSVAVSLRELGRRLSAIEGEQTPPGR